MSSDFATLDDDPTTKYLEADYKPGRFKHLDEAIRNTKKR